MSWASLYLLGSDHLPDPLGTVSQFCEGENNVLTSAHTLASHAHSFFLEGTLGTQNPEVLSVPEEPTPPATPLSSITTILQVPPSDPQVHRSAEIRLHGTGLRGVRKATSKGHLLFLAAGGEVAVE